MSELCEYLRDASTLEVSVTDLASFTSKPFRTTAITAREHSSVYIHISEYGYSLNVIRASMIESCSQISQIESQLQWTKDILDQILSNDTSVLMYMHCITIAVYNEEVNDKVQ